MTPRFLVNEDGRPFEHAELAVIEASLHALQDSDRLTFRNSNAEHVATHPAPRMLVISGPGTGKSTLFKKRIENWLAGGDPATVLAVSFVRKLLTPV